MADLTSEEREKIKEKMNGNGTAYKRVNWIRLLKRVGGRYLKVEVGYWITYLNCEDKYNKEIITIKI